MKLRSTIRTLTLAGTAAAVFVPGVVMAAPTFGTWAAAGGTITGCGAGWTCTTLVSENGFLQQQVDIGSQTFFQTVVTDSGVTGNQGTLQFAGETFVEQAAGGSGNGVMSKLSVNDVTSGNGMTSSAELQTGNFAGSGAGILVNQAISDNNATSGTGTAANDDFSSTLILDRNLSTTGAVTGTDLRLGQSVGLDLSTLQSTATFDKTSFALRRVSGDANTFAGTRTAVLPTGQGSTTTLGGTVDWRTSNDVVVTWIGQRISLDTLGMQFAGYQSVQNLSSAFGGGAGTQRKDTFDFGATNTQGGPWAWGGGSNLESSFGTSPAGM